MPVKQYKKREDIPEKYKWDLEAMLRGKTPKEHVQEFEKLFKDLIAVKDSKYESKESFLKALKKEDELTKVSNILINWIQNNTHANLADPKINAFREEFSFLEYNLSKELGPEEPRIFEHQKDITKWLELPEFKDYRSTYLRIFETKKHQLPKAIQEFRTLESRADVDASEVFQLLVGTELDFGFATDTKGKKIKITSANAFELGKHKDKQVRKTSQIGYRNGYLKHKNTLSNLLYQHFKHATTWAKLEKFDKVIDYLVFDDRSSEKLLLSLYKAVQDNKTFRKEYKQIFESCYKKKFGEKPTRYDGRVELVSVQSSYSIEAQQEMVLKSLEPFGKDYTDVIQRAFDERWIDYKPVVNKDTGAYSIGWHYGLDKKYVLMNDDGSIRSAETLAHELGHSMHSYFSDLNNHIRESSYKIFVAEIASIFNELMLHDYLLATTKDDKLKFYIRQQQALGFEGTVFRQIEWSNYEYDVYRAIEAGQPLSTYAALSKVYYENHNKYVSKIDKFKEENQYPSIYVPHFYAGFYVYKYAIGQLVATIFFKRYKEQGTKALHDYVKNFLSAGTKLTPLELLKANDIDLEDAKTYEPGFAAAFENLREFKKLAKKLFKF